ncbi:MAG: hypothetical protein C0485_13980 [Pirellula sp.]|nr:hypothetical protein [Pirellula sp.]
MVKGRHTMNCLKFLRTWRIVMMVGVAALSVSHEAKSDDDVWKTAVSAAWTAGASWVDGSTPDSADDQAEFNLPGAYTVSFASNPHAIGQLRLSGGSEVTFASTSKSPPVVPRTLHLDDIAAVRDGNLIISAGSALTLGSGGNPFHLTADGGVGVGGTLNVKFGSDLTSKTMNPNGQLNIVGAGSTATVTDASRYYDGAANVTAGGAMQTTDANFGMPISISGVGSRWTNNGQLRLGLADTTGQKHALVSVVGGGLFESTGALLGDQLGTTGTVTVSDSGSLWRDTGSLRIGGIGPGTVNVQPGGTVVAGETIIATQGRLRLQGGTLDVADLNFQGGQLDWTAGTLHVDTYHGDLGFAVGTLAPGHSPGSTNITGTYAQQSAGILEIEVGGAAQGTLYDVVNVAGNATLGGVLDLKLVGGFVPTPSQTFTIMSANSISGSFSNVTSGSRLSTPGGGSFRVNYGPGSAFAPSLIVLSAFQSSTSGDFDVDGDVDGNDFLLWQRGGSPSPNSAADLALWRVNFGTTGGAAANNPVPEPNAALLAILAISLLTARGSNRFTSYIETAGHSSPRPMNGLLHSSGRAGNHFDAFSYLSTLSTTST